MYCNAAKSVTFLHSKEIPFIKLILEVIGAVYAILIVMQAVVIKA